MGKFNSFLGFSALQLGKNPSMFERNVLCQRMNQETGSSLLPAYCWFFCLAQWTSSILHFIITQKSPV
jgi:hypothetical protein